jgi:undecaprenyl-diphosphatase
LFNCLVSAGLLLVLSIEVRGHHVTRLERDVFQLVNGLPGVLEPLLATVMQLGSYVAVFAAALGAVLLRRRRLAVELLTAGNGAYYLAFAVKLAVARQRPAAYLRHIQIREIIGGTLGYPSGHMAVATALGLTVARAMPRRFRHFVWWAVFIVGFARIYVGAHLPVDVVGGFLVGWLVYCLTQLALGRQRPAESLAHLRAVLAEKGIEIVRLTYLFGDARGSIPLHARTSRGEELFVKITSNEQRDADWLYKLYRRLLYRNIEDEVPFLTAKQKSEHEGYLSLLAERAGVRTPRLLLTATDEDGNTLLVQQFVTGTTLDRATPQTLGAAALADVWQQVALLHRAGIAHRDLRAANVLIRDASAYVVDLSFAEENASADQQARDLVEPLVTTADLTGAGTTVSAARQIIGCAALSASLPYLQKAALSRAGRKRLQRRPDLLDQLRTEIMHQCHAEPAKPARLSRLTRRSVFTLVMLGLAVHFFLPQLGELHTALRDIVQANPWWLLCSGLASVATYVFSAFAFRSAVPVRLPFTPVMLVQVANSFANRLAPSSLGGVALSIRFLQKQGVPAVTASTAVAIIRLAGVLTAVAFVPVLLLFTHGTRVRVMPPRRGLATLLVVLGLLLLSAAVLAIPRLRHRGRRAVRQAIDTVRSLLASRRAPQLLAMSLALTLAYGASLYFALLAAGASSSIPHVLLVSVLGEGVGAAAPTPGGLGATEAATVSGLLLVGVPIEAAIAGVLIYRLMTFWLPMAPGFAAFRRLAKQERV